MEMLILCQPTFARAQRCYWFLFGGLGIPQFSFQVFQPWSRASKTIPFRAIPLYYIIVCIYERYRNTSVSLGYRKPEGNGWGTWLLRRVVPVVAPESIPISYSSKRLQSWYPKERRRAQQQWLRHAAAFWKQSPCRKHTMSDHCGWFFRVVLPLRGLRLPYPTCLVCGLFVWHSYRCCAHTTPKHWCSLVWKKHGHVSNHFRSFFPLNLRSTWDIPLRGRCAIASPRPNRCGCLDQSSAGNSILSDRRTDGFLSKWSEREVLSIFWKICLGTVQWWDADGEADFEKSKKHLIGFWHKLWHGTSETKCRFEWGFTHIILGWSVPPTDPLKGDFRGWKLGIPTFIYE